MSASSQKKLRKEQNAANLTEKQRHEKTEAKKLRTNTIIFVLVMVLIASTVLGILGVRAINYSGIIDRNTLAATIGEHELNSVTMSYFYGDAINNAYYNWYSSYGQYMSLYLQWLENLDLSKPLNKQIKDAETKQTWADYFIATALDDAKRTYTFYDLAVADQTFMQSDSVKEAMEEIDKSISNLDTNAMLSGYENAKAYLRNVYGYGCDAESYGEYLKVTRIASEYYAAHQESLEYEDADRREKDKDLFGKYSSFNGAYAYFNYVDFRGEGQKDDKGNVTYTDEQNEAARNKMKEVAESILGAKTVEELKDLVSKLEVNKCEDEEEEDHKHVDTVSVSELKYTLYSKLATELQNWFASSDRKAGDIALIPVETTVEKDGTETKVINGYYVAFFQSEEDNKYMTGTVRHLLVKFTGGTKNEETGETVYSQEEKDKAKEQAEKLLGKWNELAEKTEEAFTQMVKEESDDTSASSGGLFSNITKNSGYVAPFQDWALKQGHQKGDVEIIETEFGYHIMYFVEYSELNYRDTMIENELIAEDMEAWEKDILKDAVITKHNTSRLKTDLVISPAY